MAILNKPGSGTWSLNTGTFGANSTPAPDSLYMMEASGNPVNAGKDVGSYDASANTADFTGTASSGDSYMAFTAANSDTIEWGAVFGITAYPFTFAVVAKDDTDRSDDQTFFGIGDSAAADRWYYIGVDAGEDPRISARNTTEINKDIVTTFNDDVWHLIVGVYTSATDRDIYMDGSLTSNDGNSVTLGTVDQARMGARPDSSASHYYEGDIAALMVWKGAGLTAAQVQTDLYNSGDPWGFLIVGLLGSGIFTGNINSGIFE